MIRVVTLLEKMLFQLVLSNIRQDRNWLESKYLQILLGPDLGLPGGLHILYRKNLQTKVVGITQSRN